MTPQECFYNAQEKYERCIKFVLAMSKNVQKTNPQFSEDIAKKEFDIILQYILLRTALADGKFKVEEGEFIDKITNNYDILKVLTDEELKNSSWSKLAEKGELKYVKEIVDKTKVQADKFIDDFINWFAVLDNNDKEYDLLSILKKEVDVLCENFILCDGETDDDEKFTALRTVAEILAVPWKLKIDD